MASVVGVRVAFIAVLIVASTTFAVLASAATSTPGTTRVSALATFLGLEIVISTIRPAVRSKRVQTAKGALWAIRNHADRRFRRVVVRTSDCGAAKWFRRPGPVLRDIVRKAREICCFRPEHLRPACLELLEARCLRLFQLLRDLGGPIPGLAKLNAQIGVCAEKCVRTLAELYHFARSRLLLSPKLVDDAPEALGERFQLFNIVCARARPREA